MVKRPFFLDNPPNPWTTGAHELRYYNGDNKRIRENDTIQFLVLRKLSCQRMFYFNNLKLSKVNFWQRRILIESDFNILDMQLLKQKR